ncbi:hypothetical protein [Streptomyces laculatispora]|uniref:hypothetical protein n=1 Tax=Streptomyces laculatispora TaxID=887464 RepID=UPI001A942E7F|nr:hypothetical protein [Streptomyces laculatispora]
MDLLDLLGELDVAAPPLAGFLLGAAPLWVRQAEADGGSRPDLLATAERAELVQLRKEAAELRRANEILKATSVLFAKELDQPRTRPTR